MRTLWSFSRIASFAGGQCDPEAQEEVHQGGGGGGGEEGGGVDLGQGVAQGSTGFTGAMNIPESKQILPSYSSSKIFRLLDVEYAFK